jgi:hypothetical protein
LADASIGVLVFRRLALAILLITCTAADAPAQLLQFPVEPAAPFMRESLDTPFARVLMAEFAKTVEKNADSVCLRSKNLDAAKLAERGRDLFERWGTGSMEKILGAFDAKRYEEKIAERAGPDAPRVLMQLRNDPVVQRYLVLERPLRLVRVLNFVIEQFDRYVLLNRIGLDSISPLSNGKDELLRADPSEAIEEALERFVSDNPSPEFRQFYRLSELASEVLPEAIDTNFALKSGPMTFFRGVETDLAELCIVKR